MMKLFKKTILFLCCTIMLIAILVPTAFAVTYEYDSAGRITAVTYDNLDNITYTYDSAGNITEQSSTFFIPTLFELGVLLFVILLLSSGIVFIRGSGARGWGPGKQ